MLVCKRSFLHLCILWKNNRIDIFQITYLKFSLLLGFDLESGFSISQLLFLFHIDFFFCLWWSFVVSVPEALWHAFSELCLGRESVNYLLFSGLGTTWLCSPASLLGIAITLLLPSLIISQHFSHTWVLIRFNCISPLSCICVFSVIMKCCSYPTG